MKDCMDYYICEDYMSFTTSKSIAIFLHIRNKAKYEKTVGNIPMKLIMGQNKPDFCKKIDKDFEQAIMKHSRDEQCLTIKAPTAHYIRLEYQSVTLSGKC